MGGPDILALLAARGLSIRPLPGGLLEVSPRDRLTDDLRALIRERRAEILAALGAAPSPGTPRPSAIDPDRPAKLAEGERDFDSAIATWRTLAQQYGLGPSPDARAEARRRRVLAMLADRPGIRYALVADPDDPTHQEAVVLAIAIRMPDGGTVTGELLVPASKYDPFMLLALVERHGAATRH